MAISNKLKSEAKKADRSQVPTELNAEDMNKYSYNIAQTIRNNLNINP